MSKPNPFDKLRPLEDGDVVRIVTSTTYNNDGTVEHVVEEATLLIEHQPMPPRLRLEAPTEHVMSTPASVSATFLDPIRNRMCALVVPPAGRVFAFNGEPKIGVRHEGCEELADLSIELDCFYCPTCRWNGRISGAWAVDVIETAKGRSRADEHY